MDAINETRLEVWQRCPGLVEETARIDGGRDPGSPRRAPARRGWTLRITASGVTARCSCRWRTPANRSSSRTAAPTGRRTRARSPPLIRRSPCAGRAGFTDVLLRGDTDFALTTAFDRWTTAGGRFVFGYDATATMVRWGQSAPPDLYEALVRRTERTLATAPRQRPANVKDRIVTDRGFKKNHDRERSAGGLRLPADHVHAALPGRGAQEKSVRRTGGAGALRRHPVLFRHHERPRPLVPRSRARGPAALRPREPDRAAEGRRPGAPRAGEHVATPTGPIW